MRTNTTDRPAELEAGPEWIRRAEVRKLLGVSELELRALLDGLQLSRRQVPLYLKSEVLALRERAQAAR